jgi:hypothetical protein
MPLERKVIDVPLAAGVNQKADPRFLELGGHAQLVNCRKQKNNAIIKRPGHTAVTKTAQGGAGPTLGACVAGGSYRGAAWMSDGTGLYVYSDAAARWLFSGRLPEAQVRDRVPVSSLAQGNTDVDACASSGYRLVLYTADIFGSGLASPSYAVLDLVTGANVVSARPVDPTLTSFAVFGARLSLCGTTAVLTYVYNGIIYGRSLDMTQPWLGWGAATALASDGVHFVGLGIYDASPVIGDATRFAIAYEFSSGGNAAVVRIFNLSFVQQSFAFTEGTFTQFISVDLVATSGGTHWMAYTAIASGAGTALRAWGFTDPTGTPSTPVTVYSWPGSPVAIGPHGIVTPAGDSSSATVFWSPNVPAAAPPQIGQMAATWTRARQFHIAAGATALQGVERFEAAVVPTSRPVIINGGCYMMMTVPSQVQGTQYLVAHDWFGDLVTANPFPARCVAIVSPRLSRYSPQNSAETIPHICNDAGSVWSVPVTTSTQPKHQAIYCQVFDFASTLRYASADLGGVSDMLLTAGQTYAHDGQNAFEMGFAYYPELAPLGGTPSGIAISATGGSMATGAPTDVYQYKLIWEWYDALGNRHQSGTSPVETADMSALGAGTSGSVTLTLPSLGLTQRRYGAAAIGGGGAKQQTAPQGVYCIPYRTAGGGQVFYRVPSSPPPDSLLCQDGQGTITFTDTISDATLQDGTHETDYTLGGFLDKLCPPGGRCRTTWDSRYCVSGCDDPSAMWFSEQLTPGLAPGFNEALNISASGAVRALAVLDDKLVIGVQRTSGYGLEFMSGQGPLDNGQQSDWSPPQQIPSDVGPIDQRGICTGPFGALFRAPVGGPHGAGGFYMLTRDLQTQYVGAAVEDSLAAFPVVSSMTVHPSAGRVYIECLNSDSAPTAGVRLVWDYIMGVWSTDQVYDVDTAGVPGSRAAWIANASQSGAPAPTYHWATAGGRVYRENVGTGAQANYDAGQWVQMTVQTALIKAAISQATRFWRVQLVGDSVDPYNFTMTLTFDGAGTGFYSETLNGKSPSFTAQDIAGFSRYPQVDVEMLVGNQLAKSLQITLTDAPPTGGPAATTGAGPSWADLSIELGVDGTKRWPNIPGGARG